MDPNAELDPDLVREGRSLAEGWRSADFEAALPLYVGGDLEPVEAATVRAWMEMHPDAVLAANAALQARSALVEGGARVGRLAEVDLWPGIRAALAAEGWLGSKGASVAGDGLERVSSPSLKAEAGAREGAQRSSEHGLRALTTQPGESADLRPAAGRRWWAGAFGGSGLAAAAAVLFTAGLAWVLGLGAERAPQPPRGVTGPVAVATNPRAPGLGSGAQAVRSGAKSPLGMGASGAIPVDLVGRFELPEGVVRLGASVGPPLEAQAEDVDLSNYHPDGGFPIGWPAGQGNAVVGGVEQTREVYLVPLRGR
ncbi:MAG: hypothetical protein R3F49_18000 [Planctomycetota bacterium]